MEIYKDKEVTAELVHEVAESWETRPSRNMIYLTVATPGSSKEIKVALHPSTFLAIAKELGPRCKLCGLLLNKYGHCPDGHVAYIP